MIINNYYLLSESKRLQIYYTIIIFNYFLCKSIKKPNYNIVDAIINPFTDTNIQDSKKRVAKKVLPFIIIIDKVL